MKVSVRDVALFLTDCRTRLPFRFGVSTLERAPLCTCRVRIEDDDGGTQTGYSADLLVPKWFDKDPGKSIERDVQELAESARAAGAAFAAVSGPESPFALWWRVYREVVGGHDADAKVGLVKGFGVALVERAVLDATCRAAKRSFFLALKEGLFGFEPGRVHPELAGWDLARSLPDAPLAEIELRHTVGLLDALRANDVAERISDGFPESLEEDVRRYGLRCFKVKLGGDRAADLERLLRVADVLADGVAGAPRLTLDGNEQYASLAELALLTEEVAARPSGARLLEGLLYFEQPLARAHSFDPDRIDGMSALNELAPVILDEADYGVAAFPRALACGYGGVSVKNCKGVFRSLLNRGLCEAAGGGAFQAAEDLTNLPVLALQQDLATVAALGIEHSERNGHHYFRGLAHLPEAEARDALARHPDLYRAGESGIELAVRDGRVGVGSLQRAGYGYDVAIRLDSRTPLDDWSFAGR